MSAEPIFGHWMVAVAEAAELAGAENLDQASATAMAEAWDLVTETAGLSHEELADGIAGQHGLEVARFREADPDAARLVPGTLAWRRNVIPLAHSDQTLVVATANPLSIEAKREIGAVSSRTVRFCVAPPRKISAAVIRTYGPPTDEAPTVVEPPPGPTGPHILVVDDEAGTRALYRSVLEDGGFRVSVARDGPEALEILGRNEGVDLVTLDYWMDKMNGLRVLQQMQARPELAGLPVIMVTGADNRAIEMSLFEAGVDDYIAKPVDPPLLVLRIRAVLRRRGWR